jgi:FRG domain
MEIHNLTSWDDFRPLIHDIRQRYGTFTRELEDGSPYSRKNQLLFRGEPEAGSESALKTTLERATAKRFDVLQYVQVVDSCVNELESFTGKQWNTKTYPELVEETKRIQDPMLVRLPNYPYLVYLRHHGFPSPLLDWTESPYIAAYFAFCDPVKADRAGIYVYIENPSGPKRMQGGDPMISVQGPYVSTHSRHFAQKAWYTVATEWSYERQEHSFCPHADVFCVPDRTQDVLIKITIPIVQRSHILRDLNDYNINHFTLFQSEDSLVKALAMRRFDMNAT